MNNALVELGRALKQADYHFTTVTPATHERVNRRPENALARTPRDVFGWSRPFEASMLDPRLLELMTRARVVTVEGALLRSRVRFSSLRGELYVHSAFPSAQTDSVFFGPDTYRFADLLGRTELNPGRLLDLGCGSGAGGLSLRRQMREIVLSDVSPGALQYAEVNAALGETSGSASVAFCQSDLLAAVTGDFDVIVANPPYLADVKGRIYRDGGGTLGTGLSHQMLKQAVQRLRPGGHFILYTGAPIVEGRDLLRETLEPVLSAATGCYEYTELDPDVFGEELEEPTYSEVERIGIISLVVWRPS